MTTEDLLRKYFGLKGEFYTKEYREACSIVDPVERRNALDDIADNDDGECRLTFTREAWDAWGRALDMLDDLCGAGYIGMDGENGDYNQFFWENLPECPKGADNA